MVSPDQCGQNSVWFIIGFIIGNSTVFFSPSSRCVLYQHPKHATDGASGPSFVNRCVCNTVEAFFLIDTLYL